MLQWVKMGYKGYNGLQGVTKGYEKLQDFTVRTSKCHSDDKHHKTS